MNADGLASTGQGFLGTNMFAYCNNEPVAHGDSSGTYSVCFIATPGDGDPSIYDRTAAVEYAEKWYRSANTPQYESFVGNGGDCANFVSQCLIAGGLNMTRNWHSIGTKSRIWYMITGNEYLYDVSPAWKLVKEQYGCFSNAFNPNTNGTVIEITSKSQIYKIAKTETVRPGDLLYFMKGDEAAHAAMISSVESGMIFYTGHSMPRFNYPLSKTDIGGKYSSVCIIRIDN